MATQYQFHAELLAVVVQTFALPVALVRLVRISPDRCNFCAQRIPDPGGIL